MFVFGSCNLRLAGHSFCLGCNISLSLCCPFDMVVYCTAAHFAAWYAIFVRALTSRLCCAVMPCASTPVLAYPSAREFPCISQRVVLPCSTSSSVACALVLWTCNSLKLFHIASQRCARRCLGFVPMSGSLAAPTVPAQSTYMLNGCIATWVSM